MYEFTFIKSLNLLYITIILVKSLVTNYLLVYFLTVLLYLGD